MSADELAMAGTRFAPVSETPAGHHEYVLVVSHGAPLPTERLLELALAGFQLKGGHSLRRDMYGEGALELTFYRGVRNPLPMAPRDMVSLLAAEAAPAVASSTGEDTSGAEAVTPAEADER